MLHMNAVIDDNLFDTNSVHVRKNLPLGFHESYIHNL